MFQNMLQSSLMIGALLLCSSALPLQNSMKNYLVGKLHYHVEDEAAVFKDKVKSMSDVVKTSIDAARELANGAISTKEGIQQGALDAAKTAQEAAMQAGGTAVDGITAGARVVQDSGGHISQIGGKVATSAGNILPGEMGEFVQETGEMAANAAGMVVEVGGQQMGKVSDEGGHAIVDNVKTINEKTIETGQTMVTLGSESEKVAIDTAAQAGTGITDFAVAQAEKRLKREAQNNMDEATQKVESAMRMVEKMMKSVSEMVQSLKSQLSSMTRGSPKA